MDSLNGCNEAHKLRRHWNRLPRVWRQSVASFQTSHPYHGRRICTFQLCAKLSVRWPEFGTRMQSRLQSSSAWELEVVDQPYRQDHEREVGDDVDDTDGIPKSNLTEACLRSNEILMWRRALECARNDGCNCPSGDSSANGQHWYAV